MPLKEVVVMVCDGGKPVADVRPSLDVSQPDLKRLKEEIREEVAALRSTGQEFSPKETADVARRAAGRPAAFDATSVRSMIDLADSFADVGLHTPPVHRFRGLIRSVARLTARMILTLSRFITDRQRNFNHLTTRSLMSLADGLERSTAGLAEQVSALEELSRRQAERVDSLEAALNHRSEPAESSSSENGPVQPEA